MGREVTSQKVQLTSWQRKAREHQNRCEIISNLERDLRDLIEVSRGIESRRSKLAEAKRIKLATAAKLDQKDIEKQNLDVSLAVRCPSCLLCQSMMTDCSSNSIAKSRMPKKRLKVN